MVQEADRKLKFLHDLDTSYKNLHKNFEVSTIFGGRLAAHFSKVLKLEAVQFVLCTTKNASLNELWTSIFYYMKHVET